MIPNATFDRHRHRIGFGRVAIPKCVIAANPRDADEGRIRIGPRLYNEVKFLTGWSRVEIFHAMLPRRYDISVRERLFFKACPRRSRETFGWIKCYPGTFTVRGCRWHEFAVFESDMHDGWGVSRSTSQITLIVPRLCECFMDGKRKREVTLAFRAV